MSQQPVAVVDRGRGPGFLVRALWFLVIGWWLSGVALLLAWLCIASIIGLPIGLLLVNAVPKLQTLRPSSRTVLVDEHGVVDVTGARQYPWWLRLLWFPLGVCLGLVATVVAWMVSVTIIGLPLSILLIDRLPAIITLHRN